MELLQTIPREVIGEDKRKMLRSKTDELVLAEAVARETLKIQEMQELQRSWNEAMLLSQNKAYDAAIEQFSGLLGTEYAAKAQAKIDELSLEAALDARRQAAELFIRFTKTSETQSRKRLLVESRKILKGILVKYPEVEISQKVLGNIQRVEQEMELIDPALLPAIIEQEQAAAAGTRAEAGSEPPAGIDAFDLPATSGGREPSVLPVNPTPALPAQSPRESTVLPILTPQDVQ